MKINKLHALLSLLSPAELRSLKDFVHSPIYNKNETLTQLLDYMVENWGNSEKITDETLFNIAYSNVPFDKTQLSRLRYNAFALVEQFIIFKEQKNYPIPTAMWLLNFYSTHQQIDFFEKTAEKIQVYFATNLRKDSQIEYETFLVEEALARFQTQSQQREILVHLPEMEEHLNVSFISRKLELACMALSRKKVLRSEFQPEMLAEVLQYVETRPTLLAYPSVAVYFYLYKMLRFPEDTAYFAPTCEIIGKYAPHFRLEEQKNLHAYLRNYCILQINQGQKAFEEALFGLFKAHLQADYLLNAAQKLHHTNFKNIVVLALRLGHIDWTADFLEKYRLLLPENKQAETYQYCLARLYFAQKAFDSVCKILQNTDFEDIFFNIDARKLLLQTYYEQQEWALLDAGMNRFRVFLHRNKTISEAHKVGNRNFVNILGKMVEHFPLKAAVSQDFEKLIQQTNPLAEKNWLLGQLAGNS